MHKVELAPQENTVALKNLMDGQYAVDAQGYLYYRYLQTIVCLNPPSVKGYTEDSRVRLLAYGEQFTVTVGESV